jgi:hypothetical protein
MISFLPLWKDQTRGLVPRTPARQMWESWRAELGPELANHGRTKKPGLLNQVEQMNHIPDRRDPRQQFRI